MVAIQQATDWTCREGTSQRRQKQYSKLQTGFVEKGLVSIHIMG